MTDWGGRRCWHTTVLVNQMDTRPARQGANAHTFTQLKQQSARLHPVSGNPNVRARSAARWGQSNFHTPHKFKKKSKKGWLLAKSSTTPSSSSGDRFFDLPLRGVVTPTSGRPTRGVKQHSVTLDNEQQHSEHCRLVAQ